MDQVFFHPKVVHLPVALAVLMPLITGGVLFAVWRGWFDRRVWVGVVLLQAALVGSGAIAMNTGEREEERVEEVVDETYIEAHEEAAETFVWASAAVLVLMVLPMALREGRARQAASLAAFLGTLIAFGFGYNAGQAGGKLVYEHGAAQAYAGERGASADPTGQGSLANEDSDGE
jgi:uncharacterized membrane protein